MDAENTDKDQPELEIDESTRYTGTVKDYNRRRGFGHILPDGEEDKRENRIFVHWKQIQSDDTWPSLEDEQKVEYYKAKKNRGRQKDKPVAAKVTLPGGGNVSANAGRTYLDNAQRFKGIVKYWNVEKGFGFIKIDSDISVGGTDFPADKDVYVPIDEIVTDDEPPALKLKDEVEFSTYKTEKGSGAAKVTQPGGAKYSYPTADRPKTPRKNNFGFGPMKGGFGGMMGIQFINGQPYALMPKGSSFGGGGWGGRGGWGGGNRQKREQGASDADGAAPSPGELSVDQDVRAKWKDGKWYSGQVKNLNDDGTIKVYWTKFRNYTDSVDLGDIRVGGSVPAAAMETDTSSSGGAVHKW